MGSYVNITKLPFFKRGGKDCINWRQLRIEVNNEKEKGFSGKIFHFMDDKDIKHKFKITEVTLNKKGQVSGFWVSYKNRSIYLYPKDIRNAEYDRLFKKYQLLQPNKTE